MRQNRRADLFAELYSWEVKSRRLPSVDSRDNIHLVNRVETSRNVVFDNVIKNVIRRFGRTSAYSTLSVKRVLVFFSSTIKNVCLERREVIQIGLRGNVSGGIAHYGLTNKSHAMPVKLSKPISMCIFALYARLKFFVWFKDIGRIVDKL